MRIHGLCALALIALAAPGVAEEKTTAQAVEELRALAGRDSQVMKHLEELCAIGPRLTGSTGINASYEYTKKTFESFGLKVRLEEWGSYPVGFDRGKSTGKMIAADGAETTLTFGTNAWTAGTDGPVRGLALLAPKRTKDVKALGRALKGAWIVGARARSGRRTSGLEEKLWEAGIAGWISPVRGELIVTSGRAPRKGTTVETAPKRVRIKLVRSQWEELSGRLQGGERIELEFDVQNRFKKGPFRHYNVVADLVGSEKPDEIVVVGGHLDTWDEATGTTDNGTGVATTLEAARLLSAIDARPKRTIRFILWSGEEQGLLGSRAYVRQHRAEMKRISAVLVHDGGTNTCCGLSVTKAMKAQIEEAFAPIVNDPKWPFTIREVDGLRGGGSDHNSYLAAGVPGFFWHQKGKANYRHTHHTQHDTLDQAVPEYQRRSALVIAAGALGIANLDRMLDRTKLLAPRRSSRRKTLGVHLDGMTVTEVVEGSRAEKAGVKTGDLIVSFGGAKVEDMGGLRGAIQKATGMTPFEVRRDGKIWTLVAEFPGKTQPARKKDWF